MFWLFRSPPSVTISSVRQPWISCHSRQQCHPSRRGIVKASFQTFRHDQTAVPEHKRYQSINQSTTQKPLPCHPSHSDPNTLGFRSSPRMQLQLPAPTLRLLVINGHLELIQHERRRQLALVPAADVRRELLAGREGGALAQLLAGAEAEETAVFCPAIRGRRSGSRRRSGV